jgi:aminodeoxyfutalosine deaminase
MGTKLWQWAKAPVIKRQFAGVALDHGDGAILPALVNAHVHLEFSALRGKIAPQPCFPNWLEKSLAEFCRVSAAEIEAGIKEGLAELRRTGTGLVGEVSHTGAVSLSWQKAAWLFIIFTNVWASIFSGMAPWRPIFHYSPGRSAAAQLFRGRPCALFCVCGPFPPHRPVESSAWADRRRASVESLEELDFLRRGTAFFRHLLKKRGRWLEGYEPPGCSPVAYLDGLGFLGDDVLAVHGVWLCRADRKILARRGTTVVLCPRSNRFTGAGFPDLPGMARAGVTVALGTDSLASNDDLNLFKEMLALHEHYPNFPLPELFALGTRHGAWALGREHDLGSLQPGRQAALLFIPIDSPKDFWPALLQAGAEEKSPGLPAPEGMTPMKPNIRLGRIHYINVLPIYYAMERGYIQNGFEMVAGTPAELNGRLSGAKWR